MELTGFPSPAIATVSEPIVRPAEVAGRGREEHALGGTALLQKKMDLRRRGGGAVPA